MTLKILEEVKKLEEDTYFMWEFIKLQELTKEYALFRCAIENRGKGVGR